MTGVLKAVQVAKHERRLTSGPHQEQAKEARGVSAPRCPRWDPGAEKGCEGEAEEMKRDLFMTTHPCDKHTRHGRRQPERKGRGV